MEEGSAKNLPEGTKGGPRGPGIGQYLAFSMSQVKERSGGLLWLMAFLVMNRSGTRIGRFTGPSFGIWALAILLAIAFPPPHEDAFTALVWGCWFMGYPILLLNLFDRSGPTREEFERARENWLRRKKRNAPQ
jgi:hypothetical protein